MNPETIIGLEIHVQLKTKSKMFCPCDNTGEMQEENSTVCPICMGHPGTLPVANQEAIDMTAMVGMALNCQIPKRFNFERKNYFYPDLPKGYQITSATNPPAIGGYLEIEVEGKQRKIRFHHIHLEEDAGKLLHDEKNRNYSLVDYNRGGTPLLEMVTEPDIHSAQEAKIFVQSLRLLMRYLNVSSADMEKGHLRCDANISMRPAGENKLYPKTEIKNLNSFKSIEKALEYEIKRQTKLWEEGNYEKRQTTRGWSDVEMKTTEQRSKEEAQDYRYFPEPDLPPIEFDPKRLEEIKALTPELPQARLNRFVQEFGIERQEAQELINDKFLSFYTEQIISELKAWLVALQTVEGSEQEIWNKNKTKLVKLVSGWLLNKLTPILLEKNISTENIPITPENFAEFITLIYENKINSSAAQEILVLMLETEKDPSDIMEEKNLGQLTDESEMEEIVQKILDANPEQVEKYKGGKENLLQFFVGQAMKETKGKANPKVVEGILRIKLR
ncbi:MAG: Asp-tRNA(Asn)/Glu-tRNA(Gln) amidotransferase subunit GatB [bacterium]